MNFKNVPLYLFAFLIIAIAAQAGHFYPLLPQYVASHFDINGNPDSYSGKQSFIIFEAAIIIFISAIFFLIVFFIRKIPASLLNLPNKEYWLSEEKKENTYNVFVGFLFLFADITLLFLYYIFNKVYTINLGQEKSLGSSFFYVIVVYFAASGIVGYLFLRRFMKGADDE